MPTREIFGKNKKNNARFETDGRRDPFDEGFGDAFENDTRAEKELPSENGGSGPEDDGPAFASVPIVRMPFDPGDEMEARKRDFDDFVRRYPGVKAEDIPAGAWARVLAGESLTRAYNICRGGGGTETARGERRRTMTVATRDVPFSTDFDAGWDMEI